MASHGVPRVSGAQTPSLQARHKEQQDIQKYKDLVVLVNAKVSEEDFTSETLDSISKLLVWNPEYYTIWNHRRRVLLYLLHNPNARAEIKKEKALQQLTQLNLITNDLAFLKPLLRKFPKCYWMWNHRLWLLEEATRTLSSSDSFRLWNEELGLIGKMLSLDNRNFHAWGYRRIVTGTLETHNPRSDVESRSMVEREFEYTTRMTGSNLSNFSAWHNRSKLIPKLLDEKQADNALRRQVLDEEFERILEALWTDPSNQSAWFYYQNLMCTLDPKHANQGMAPNLTADERLQYLTKEMDNILELLADAEGSADCKWMYQSLIEMSELYKDLSNQWPSQANHMKEWIVELQRLDPSRRGRWEDLGNAMSESLMER